MVVLNSLFHHILKWSLSIFHALSVRHAAHVDFRFFIEGETKSIDPYQLKFSEICTIECLLSFLNQHFTCMYSESCSIMLFNPMLWMCQSDMELYRPSINLL